MKSFLDRLNETNNDIEECVTECLECAGKWFHLCRVTNSYLALNLSLSYQREITLRMASILLLMKMNSMCSLLDEYWQHTDNAGQEVIADAFESFNSSVTAWVC